MIKLFGKSMHYERERRGGEERKHQSKNYKLDKHSAWEIINENNCFEFGSLKCEFKASLLINEEQMEKLRKSTCIKKRLKLESVSVSVPF